MHFITPVIQVINSVSVMVKHNQGAMEDRGLIHTGLIIVFCVCVVTGSPIGTSTIQCDSSTALHLGSVDEGYTGDVELVNGIPSGRGVTLVPHSFPTHLEYIELIFTPGQTSATVRTKKPLDADALQLQDSTLYYSLMCEGGSNKLKNTRTLKINDINNKSPIFEKKLYTTTVSEVEGVNKVVLRVKAVDGDSTTENNKVSYSFAPASEYFNLTSSGVFILNKRLNYNVIHEYNFTVTARDNSGRNDTATVLISVEDFDNLNPHFSHNVYQATIIENQVGTFRTILPEAIKAQDGDTGINMSLVYSISSVTPEKYRANFNIDPSSGVVSVGTAIDREEMSSSVIAVNIQAAQTDDSLKTAVAVVSVTVEDENDNSPEFDQPAYNVTLLENSPVDAVVFKATVTDLDQGGFVGTLRIIPDSAPFSIGSDGTVRVKNSTTLDRETIESITFQIEARETSPPNRVVLVPVSVTLLDENDNSPVFTSETYDGKVFANQTVGMFLVQVEAEDPDADANGEINYSIEFGNKEGYFSIDGNTGEITLLKTIPLVENKVLEFPLYITARDGGTIPRSSSALVNIRAPGNSKPQFLHKVYRGTIQEEQDPGVLIVKVDFLAIAAVIPVTLRVESEAEKFAISSSGEFSTKVKLDYDDAPHSYNVSISISDGVSSDSAVVQVQVTDVNDNSPVFTSSSVTKSVPENAEVGDNVTAVPATDKDSGFNQEIRYSLTGAEGKFSIDPVSGMVSVSAALDRETKAAYRLLVVAEDQGRPALSATASLLVQVTDINDNAPKFSQAEYQLQVSETESVNASLLTLSAADPDEGDNGRVTYSILKQTPSSERAVFELDPSSGTLRLAQPLDYSEVKMFSLVVQASDGGTPSLVGNGSVVVKVEDVNNNPPQFSKERYDLAVSENLASGVSILTLEVTDKDEGGFVGTLRIIPESSPFSIGSDGTIRVKNSTALDRETTDTIMFQVEARETEPPNHVATVNVNITLLDENDNSPRFTSSMYESKVFTNQTAGMLLVKVEAEDPDAGVNGQIVYSISFGNQNDYFSIDENTGAITLRKIIPLERQKTSEFLLFITASDGGVVSRSSSSQVKILAVGDSYPYFRQSIYGGTIEEEKEPGTVILMVDFLATEGVPITLRVESEAEKFAISSSGELTTKVKLDYDDAPHSYNVSISISDGVSSDSAVVQVQVTDVNDNSPVFTSSSVTKSVPENAEVGDNVTAVPATDKDSGFNQEIRYSLTGAEGKFSIDPVSGMVSVSAALDRETKAEYRLLVVAEDQGRPALSATASLLVQVTDINDNAPKFSQAEYQLQVLETESVNASLLTLSAADPDEGDNGRVTYSILKQTPSSERAVFELDPSSGTLRLAQPLDYSEVKMFSLVVQASDGGTPSLVGNGSVVVKVEDVNNNPPQFSKERYDVAVSENLASGASILTLEVTDRDEGGFSNGSFQYSSDTFDINKQGVVSLRKNVTLDRETKDSYILQVVAVDQLTGGLSSTAQLNIFVLDYNDNAPQFPVIPDPLPVPEGQYSEENPGEIVTIVPTDADLGPNGEVSVSLVTPNPLFRFREDGTLLAVGPLDRENKDSYDLIVKASDKGSPQRESVTTIRVTVTDVNDNSPEFSSSSYVVSLLLKDAAKGKLLLTLSASDRDTGDNALISYSFSAGSSPYLALNSETGAVTLTSDLADVTVNTELVLTAMATDHGLPPLNSTALVVVNLRVVSLVEGVVAFRSSLYNFSLPENSGSGAAVGSVWASSGSAAYDVTYAVKTHTELFSVDASGAIATRAQLDREQQQWYILEVEAVDTRTPPTSATAVVRVEVEDVNESPLFPLELYKASVFSIAPYKTPVIQVKASDPDIGEEGRLVYSLPSESLYFAVEPSSGLLYVVSVSALAGQTAAVAVRATDPRGLHVTTSVEVVVQGDASSSDVVTISLNQPANTVERKVTQLETSLGAALGWTVSIIDVSSGGASESRRAAVKTLVSFISLDAGKVVSSEEVTKKLQSQSAAVIEELNKVFGDGLVVEVEPQGPSDHSDQPAVIALAVLLALCMLGLIIAVAFLVRFKMTEKHQADSDKESFEIDRCAEGYTNKIWSDKISETSEQGETPKSEDDDQKTDKQTEGDGRVRTESISLKVKRDGQTDSDDDDDEEGSTTSL